jgi:cell division protein FtsB
MAVQAQDINTMNSLSTSDKIQMLRVIQDLQAQITAAVAANTALEARVAALEAAAE